MDKVHIIFWTQGGNTGMMATAMGCEVLEETEMEPFVSEVERIIKEKKIVLFGSYGWGDGQWMRDWEERMKSAGAIILENN